MLSSMSDNRSNYLVSVDVGCIHASATWLNLHTCPKGAVPAFELGESFPLAIFLMKSCSTQNNCNLSPGSSSPASNTELAFEGNRAKLTIHGQGNGGHIKPVVVGSCVGIYERMAGMIYSGREEIRNPNMEMG